MDAFSSDSQCVAIHIRRGDRIVEGVDMRKYCRDHKGEQVVEDLGCRGVNPFGALSLNDYLERSYKLLPTRNVFVMTDDGAWLKQQKTLLPAEAGWNIYELPAPKERYSSANGLEFFTSVALARKCNALVGNFMSGVSMLVHEAMCVHHANKVGECPPVVDIGKEYNK